MNIEPLSREKYIRFDGSPPPVSMTGVCVTDGSEVLAVVGVSVIVGERFIVFGMKDECPKKMIIKGWAAFRDRYLCDKKEYYALIDEELPTAPGLMRHFGFKHFKEDIYIYRG